MSTPPSSTEAPTEPRPNDGDTQAQSSPSPSPASTRSSEGQVALQLPATSQFFAHAAHWSPAPAEFTSAALRLPPALLDAALLQWSYKKVSSNWYNEEFVRRPSYLSDEDRVELCSCKDGDDCEDNCVNRAMLIECSKKCSKGDKCKNQRLSRRQYAKTSVVKTADRGHGLVAAELIPAGALILEYCGEVISQAECYARLSTYEEWGVKDFYMFQLSAQLVIDARLIGNAARFINHSCDANAYTQTWTVGAQQRVGIWAKRDIQLGEEVTYNYNAQTFNARGKHNGVIQHCRCGAPNCSQFLGEKTPVTNRKHKGANGKKEDKGKQGKKRKAGALKAEVQAGKATKGDKVRQQPPKKPTNRKREVERQTSATGRSAGRTGRKGEKPAAAKKRKAPQALALSAVGESQLNGGSKLTAGAPGSRVDVSGAGREERQAKRQKRQLPDVREDSDDRAIDTERHPSLAKEFSSPQRRGASDVERRLQEDAIVDDLSTESDSDSPSAGRRPGAAPHPQLGRRPLRVLPPSPESSRSPPVKAMVNSETVSDDDDLPLSFFCKIPLPVLTASPDVAALDAGEKLKDELIDVCDVTAALEDDDELHSSSSLSTTFTSSTPSSPLPHAFVSTEAAKESFSEEPTGSFSIIQHAALKEFPVTI